MLNKEIQEIKKALKGIRESQDEYHRKILAELIIRKNYKFKEFVALALKGTYGPQAQAHAEELAIDILHIDETAEDETAERTVSANQGVLV
jgi:hypothetical protein